MRRAGSFARGLGVVAALLGLCAPALAATPRGKKPATTRAGKRPAKPVEEPKAEPEPAAAPEPVEEKPPPEPQPARAPEKPETAPSKAGKPPEVAVELDETPAPKASEAPSDDSSDAALGRREAARIADGRIEVAVWLSAGVLSRHFTYSDAVGYGLAPYTLGAAPMASLGMEAYPAAGSGVPGLRDLGLRGQVTRGFAFDSNTPQGDKLETSWTRFSGELRQRLIVPGPHRLEVGVYVGADASYFGMTTTSRVPALLPAARTVALRFGFDTRIKLGWRLSAMLGAAYLDATSKGEIYEQFRAPRLAGVDGDLGFGVDVGSGIEVRLTGRYTRYFATFKPRLGDVNVAGGALDEQLQCGLGARYAH